MATIKQIIVDAAQKVCCVERDNVPTEIRDLALSVVNSTGKDIFEMWPWDNSKIDEFVAPASNSDGIITFASTVDVIRAIRPVNANADLNTPVFAQDEILAAIAGEDVSSSSFIYLADSSSGYRRIKVPEESESNIYKVLALKRFITYQSLDSGDAGYDATRDYNLVSFVIDRAETALRASVEDGLRDYMGYPRKNDWGRLVGQAIGREQETQQRERRVNVRYPLFSEVGNYSSPWDY